MELRNRPGDKTKLRLTPLSSKLTVVNHQPYMIKLRVIDIKLLHSAIMFSSKRERCCSVEIIH